MGEVETRGPEYLISTMVFLGFTWLCFLTRMAIRFFIIRSPFWDDYFLAFGMLSCTALGVTVPLQVAHGAGKHIPDIHNPHDIAVSGFWFYLAEEFYLLSMWSIKVSLCILILRLELPKVYNRVLYTIIAITTLFTIYFLFWITFQCTPVSLQWDKSVDGHCISRAMFANSVYALRAINAATDVCTAVLPAVAIFRLRNLNFDTKARIGASLTIAVGSAACIVTFVSFKFVKDYEATEDLLFAVIPLSITSNVEVALGIICASLATFRPLVRLISGNSRRTYVSDSSYQKYGESRNGSRASRLTSLSRSRSRVPLDADEPVVPAFSGGVSGGVSGGRTWRRIGSDDTTRKDVSGMEDKGLAVELDRIDSEVYGTGDRSHRKAERVFGVSM